MSRSREVSAQVDTRGGAYRGSLVALSLASMAGLSASFIEIQKVYAVIGALFSPALAAVLLALNGRASMIGTRHRNRPATTAVLVATLALFVFFGWVQLC